MTALRRLSINKNGNGHFGYYILIEYKNNWSEDRTESTTLRECEKDLEFLKTILYE